MEQTQQSIPWTVQLNQDTLSLSSFESALSYADGLANRQFVKQIDPEKHLIRLVPRVADAAAFSTGCLDADLVSP